MAPESPRASRLPERIGRYRIVDRVGRGAMGVVYAAHDETMGRAVAVKVLTGDLESDPKSQKRFYREAQAAAGLLHPNIITIYDAGEDQGRPYIAMQLLEGAPLSQYLKRVEGVSLEKKLDLMMQTCEGLLVAHSRGIVHRDLKPGNLFVQSDGLLKILDFGVARLAGSSMTEDGMRLGTPDYMSPEQARGETVDARSDIFSLGAVFYFMLAARKPFPGPDLPAVFRQIASEEPVALTAEQAPPELARLLMQAMAKAPADRPQRIQDLLTGIIRVRRQFEAGARRLAAEAGSSFNGVVRAFDDLRRAGQALRLNPDQEPLILNAVRARYPAVAAHSGAGIETISGDRLVLEPLVADLRRESERLTDEAARRARAIEHMAAAAAALDSGDARASLRLVSALRDDYPASPVVTELYQRAVTRVQELDTRGAQAAQLVDAAHACLARGDLPGAAKARDAALALVPKLSAALTLTEAIEQTASDQARRRALEIQQLLQQTEAAIHEQRFDEAESLLERVDRFDNGAMASASWRSRLAAARAQAAESARLRRITTEQLTRARGIFRRGRYDEAVETLTQFCRQHPQSREAAEELSSLDRLRHQLREAERTRAQQAAVLVQAARISAGERRFDDAIADAAEALRQDPFNAPAVTAFDEFVTRDLDAQAERARLLARQAREQVAARMLAAAREAQRRGYLAAAFEAATGAERIAPGFVDASDYVTTLRVLLQARDETLSDLANAPIDATPATIAAAAPAAPAASAAGGDGAGPGRGEAAPNRLSSAVRRTIDLLRRGRP